MCECVAVFVWICVAAHVCGYISHTCEYVCVCACEREKQTERSECVYACICVFCVLCMRCAHCPCFHFVHRLAVLFRKSQLLSLSKVPPVAPAMLCGTEWLCLFHSSCNTSAKAHCTLALLYFMLVFSFGTHFHPLHEDNVLALRCRFRKGWTHFHSLNLCCSILSRWVMLWSVKRQRNDNAPRTLSLEHERDYFL